MVDPEEFDRVREFLDEAIREEYSDLLVEPVEIKPGVWAVWPLRQIQVGLEETRFWSYGKPGQGTGKLQVHIHYPYGNDERIKPRGEAVLDEKLVRRAVKTARQISAGLMEHYKVRGEEQQKAYLFGYHALVGAGPEKFERLWPAYKETFNEKGSYSAINTLITDFFFELRKKDPAQWDALFAGEEGYQSPREWSPRIRSYNESRKDMFYRGVVSALDDWARENGLIED